MAYKIKFKNSVSKDLKKIDKSIASDILDKIDTDLSINADKNPSLKGKFAGLRKFRVGDYRIIYSIIEIDTILILRIAHRKEAYRK
ncbi:type II toxin-antitoxin system RelE/ParE family toxin [candidate division KSB1 bacterium]|nr:type II toxin-antitoxin system RelE/ParE family toxin [candidate division KSB1 bacterium]